jgi:hypothetical protein
MVTMKINNEIVDSYKCVKAAIADLVTHWYEDKTAPYAEILDESEVLLATVEPQGNKRAIVRYMDGETPMDVYSEIVYDEINRYTEFRLNGREGSFKWNS